MGEWKECKLGDILTLNYGKALKSENRVTGDYPVYSSAGLTGYHNAPLVNSEGLIVGRKGTIGKVYYSALPFYCIDTAYYILPNEKTYNLTYIYYLLNTLGLDDLNEDSAVPGLNRETAYSQYILIPPLPEQKAIASVLSSLDDKIDLLHRQNKTLEAMAETLFRQWFVEEAQEDWEEVDLEHVTERITDGSHYSPPTVEIGLPMASVKDMHNWGIYEDTCRRISEEAFNELTRGDCKPRKNDIIIAKDGSYLKHVFVAPEDLDIVILSSIAILRPKDLYDPVLLSIFLKMESTFAEMENYVTGAVIPRIVLKDFRKFPVILPPKETQIKALEIIRPLYSKCWKNTKQINTLEKLRDTLLPKLMSGEVRVAYD